MATESFTNDVLQMFYGPINEVNLPNPLVPARIYFWEARTEFREWLHVWKSDAPKTDNRDIFRFAERNEKKFVDVVEDEMQLLGMIKVSFALLVKMTKKTENDEITEIKQYFKQTEESGFQNANEEEIKEKFMEFINEVNNKIEGWIEAGSNIEYEAIERAYVNAARYEPLRGGTYLPLPAELQYKKAIINVQNKKDSECLKWSLRTALFLAPKDKNPLRIPSYPTNDGINYEGIDFPTPVNQIDKLEEQNENLAINVFGWNDQVIVYRLSTKDKFVPCTYKSYVN